MDLLETLKNVEDLETQSTEVHYESTENDGYKSSFASLYKAKSFDSQEKRRENLLLSIKVRRYQTVDEKRDLNDLFEIDEDVACETDLLEPMEVVTKLPKRRRRRRKKILKFGDALMMSEWLAEVPSDLEKNWLVKLCPVGIRNMIVAHNGITQSFNRKGKLLANHTSHLPGGGPSTPFHKFTVLDCIFASNCYYVLDVVAWNSFSLKKSNTEMRFYWIKSKLEETPELLEQSDANPFAFREVNYFPAELPLVEEKLSCSFIVGDEEVPLDGVLFYHRDTTYLPCITPLVGWLKPYMVPEMLHVPVGECFMEKKPKHYVSLAHYLENKHKKRDVPGEKMDC
ncbi:hypothetical protein RN001_009238 [Aquatica leii]|uniref:Snurportin-1 n=1 Tax=Aquatica leii TaxID=1421715 RepID=A0AAN7P4Y5_9COLE|nr:hypothetical protein RN001_009238 [Aquatica leii]